MTIPYRVIVYGVTDQILNEAICRTNLLMKTKHVKHM